MLTCYIVLAVLLFVFFCFAFYENDYKGLTVFGVIVSVLLAAIPVLNIILFVICIIHILAYKWPNTTSFQKWRRSVSNFIGLMDDCMEYIIFTKKD